MAALDQSAEFLQKLSLDPKKNAIDSKKGSENQYKAAGKVETGPKGAFTQFDRSATPVHTDYMDPSLYYLQNGYPTTYYCGGFDGEEYPRYLSPDAGWELYNHGYCYPPYGPYPSTGMPVPMNGHGGQLFGSQHYQLPTSYYQLTKAANVPKQNPSSKDVTAAAAVDKPSLSLEPAKANFNDISKLSTDGINGSVKQKLGQQNSSFTSNGSKVGKGFPSGGLPSPAYEDPRFGFDAMWSPVAWYGGSQFPEVQQRPAATNSVASKATHASGTLKDSNFHPLPQYLGMHAQQPEFGPVTPGSMNKKYPNMSIYRQNNSSFGYGSGFGSNHYGTRLSNQWWVVSDNKYKSKNQEHGLYSNVIDKLYGFGELNRGPRADLRNQKDSAEPVTHAVKGLPDIKQYNRADFPEAYTDAKFFIIKSYSEDDVHKSIKYNVWASTPNGNKKLDSAYQEGQEKSAGCPIFLFFSVNTSGQFVGVAEMVGRVDFNKTVEHWQQDKWTGSFPVKWHIVKDVPNGILKHITLENNDNKPVTNSRDTQEVKLEKGIKMIKIFKEHISKTSILDDFSFYDDRQKLMQEKRTKLQEVAKKIMDGKPLDAEEREKEALNGKPMSELQVETVAVLKNEALPNGTAQNATAATALLSLTDLNSAIKNNAE